MDAVTLLDSHLHLDFFPQPEAELRAATAAGVGGFVVPGVWRQGWPRLLQLAQQFTVVRAALGLHPQAAGQWSPETERELAAWLQRPEVVAVGEIGLDGSPGYPPAELQERAFRGQLRLALAAGRPVLLHCRRATERVLTILREEGGQRSGGIWHAFSGSPQTAARVIDLGFALGFGGPLTWPNARRGPEVLTRLPDEWIVLESDAPDLPPHPHQREENRPAWLPLIAARVADLRGWSLEQTARITTTNARRVLKL
ncbi:MAG: TatD family hydrolase [Desulfuromonadales bacterium]|nr:TatD family hydrolase [Desulfuromonadales bacterium]